MRSPARLALLLALLAAAPAPAAVRPYDVRDADPAPSASGKPRGLPPGARVDSDRRTGGVREVARPGTPLTGPSSADPAAVALGWARTHRDVLGVEASALDALELRARAVDPQGTTHLRWVQVADGLDSYDTGLEAHVDRTGRLLAVQGAPVDGLRAPAGPPRIGAGEALVAAGAAPSLPPAATPPAEPVLLATADGPRRAWRVTSPEHEALVDTQTGRLLLRRPLVQDADADGFPRDPDAGPLTTRTLPPGWAADTSRLAGRFVHAYADLDDDDVADQGEDVAAVGGHWRFPLVLAAGTPCPASGCTWDGTDRSSAAPNRPQAATNAFLLVNDLHDHLAAGPIGFDAASGAFEDGDRVRVEVHDGGGLNNANMWTPPDGTSPRMQLYLWTTRDVDSAHDASVVFHEYVHGLTNRLVVTPGGSSALVGEQARSMGEAWSDWYAMDALVARGLAADGPTPDVRVGTYVVGGGIRSMPMDCPPDGGGTPCGSGGGLTYGDMAARAVPHSAGEVWAQLLWDLRRAFGPEVARALVTGGLRLAPDDPDVLDARDAILLADGGARAGALWSLFAARGMGASAQSPSSSGDVAGIVEAFDVPGGLRHAATAITEAAGASDADGVLEPGEAAEVVETLRNPGPAAVSGATGILTSSSPSVAVSSAAATWPAVLPGAQAAGTALRAVVAPTAACYTTATLSLSVTDSAGVRTIPVPVRIGPVTAEGFPGPSAAPALAIPDGSAAGVTATLGVPDGETITDLNVRIDDLRHTWVGDLVVTLRHDGVAVRLLDRMGRGTSGYGNPGDDLVDVVLDDEADAPLEDAPRSAAPFSGRWRPAEELSAFDGRSTTGTWTLEVADLEPADTGTLQRFGISTRERPCVSQRQEPAAPPVVDPGPAPPLPPAAAEVTAPVPSAPPGPPPPGPPPPPAVVPETPVVERRPASVPTRPVLEGFGLPRTVRVRRGRFSLAFRAPPGASGTASLLVGRRRVGRVQWRATRAGRVVASGRASRVPPRARRATLVVATAAGRVRRAVVLRAR